MSRLLQSECSSSEKFLIFLWKHKSILCKTISKSTEEAFPYRIEVPDLVIFMNNGKADDIQLLSNPVWGKVGRNLRLRNGCQIFQAQTNMLTLPEVFRTLKYSAKSPPMTNHWYHETNSQKWIRKSVFNLKKQLLSLGKSTQHTK